MIQHIDQDNRMTHPCPTCCQHNQQRTYKLEEDRTIKLQCLQCKSTIHYPFQNMEEKLLQNLVSQHAIYDITKILRYIISPKFSLFHQSARELKQREKLKQISELYNSNDSDGKDKSVIKFCENQLQFKIQTKLQRRRVDFLRKLWKLINDFDDRSDVKAMIEDTEQPTQATENNRQQILQVPSNPIRKIHDKLLSELRQENLLLKKEVNKIPMVRQSEENYAKIMAQNFILESLMQDMQMKTEHLNKINRQQIQVLKNKIERQSRIAELQENYLAKMIQDKQRLIEEKQQQQRTTFINELNRCQTDSRTLTQSPDTQPPEIKQNPEATCQQAKNNAYQRMKKEKDQQINELSKMLEICRKKLKEASDEVVRTMQQLMQLRGNRRQTETSIKS